MYEGICSAFDSTHVVGCFHPLCQPYLFQKYFACSHYQVHLRRALGQNEYPMPVLMSETLSDSLFRTQWQ